MKLSYYWKTGGIWVTAKDYRFFGFNTVTPNVKVLNLYFLTIVWGA